MNSKYILKLIVQFHKAVGTDISKWDTPDFIIEFSEWLKENKKVVEEYSEFLECLGINFYDFITVEIGKGKYDSIVKPETTLISPFAKEPSELFLMENMPLIISKEGIFKADDINLFLTHNPYSEEEISNWYKIHNNGLQDISVGVYGKIYDQDKKEKIDMLKKLIQKLNDDIKEEYSTNKDNYFYNVSSKRKVLKKILTK